MYKFECNCNNEAEFAEMVNEVRNEKWGTNFEVGARLWWTPDDFNKSIMVEYHIATKDCRELTGEDDEPDWFTAYEVNNEDDDDCSNEIFSDTISNDIKLRDLANAMWIFAIKMYESFIEE